MTKEFDSARKDVDRGLQINPASKEFKLLKTKVPNSPKSACLHLRL